jgi:hypothetical protein
MNSKKLYIDEPSRISLTELSFLSPYTVVISFFMGPSGPTSEGGIVKAIAKFLTSVSGFWLLAAEVIHSTS